MVIGIISDTHGLLRKEVLKELEGCNLIIHAGDIGKMEVIKEVNEIAKVEFIRGNCDKSIDLSVAQEDKVIEILGKRIYLIHNIKELNRDLQKEKIDIVVYGHSHKSNIHEKNGIIYINPGSVGPKRFKLPISMAKLTIVEDKQEYEFSNTKNICNIKDYGIEIITIDS